MEMNSVEAPSSIVECVHNFVKSIRDEQQELYPSLSKALGIDEEVVDLYLERLNNLFV